MKKELAGNKKTKSIGTRFQTNQQITAPTVKLVGVDGSMLGVLPTQTAFAKATCEGLDLVVVNADSEPPICKIMDCSRVRYQQKKKQRDSARFRAQPRRRLKQLRLTQRTEPHDVQLAITRARKFLVEKHQVKFNIIFRGRDRNHVDRGRELVNTIEESLADLAKLDHSPKRERTSLSALFIPR